MIALLKSVLLPPSIAFAFSSISFITIHFLLPFRIGCNLLSFSILYVNGRPVTVKKVSPSILTILFHNSFVFLDVSPFKNDGFHIHVYINRFISYTEPAQCDRMRRRVCPERSMFSGGSRERKTNCFLYFVEKTL